MRILRTVDLKFGRNRMLRTKLKFFLLSTLVFGLNACVFEKEEFWYQSAHDAVFQQVDRIGLPYVYEVLSENEDQSIYNALTLGDPSTDVDVLAPLIFDYVESFRAELAAAEGMPAIDADAATPEKVAAMLAPNVLVFDLSKDIDSFNFNGFGLQNDDAFDAVMQLVTGRAELKDGVKEESKAHTKSFPYLSRQNY